MLQDLIKSIVAGTVAVGCSFALRGLSGKPLFDAIDAALLFGVVSCTSFWINRRARSAP